MQIKLPMALMGCLLALPGTAPAAAPITLVESGKPAATIVIADQPTAIPLGEPSTVVYAAEELQRFIEKASGARLQIVPAAKAPAVGTLLLVGRSAVSQRYQLAPPTKPEGLRVVTFARGVAILGEVAPAGTNNIRHEVDRGTLHGVYEFLERIVGYRFFIHTRKDPDFGIVTPVVKTLTVPADCQLELAPDFPFRRGGFQSWGDPPAWMRVTREGSATGIPVVNHTDSGFRKFFKDHPDWAALKADGTRDSYYPCYSHPGVLSAHVQLVENVYSGKGGWTGHCPPGPKWIAFEPADIWDMGVKGLCQCDRCKPQYSFQRGRFGKTSHLLFRFGVEYAAEIRKRWPNKRLGVLAYEGHMLPPDFAIPQNMDVQVCMMWSTTMGKEPYWHERNLQLLRDWSKKLDGKRERLYRWNYFCWPAFWTEAPLFFPHNLQKWLQDTHAISGGEFVCGGGNPPQYELVMCWLWHRLMWDRNADVDALIRDQCTTFFGPAGETMEKVYATVIDRYENVRWSRRFNESYIPADQMYGETYTPEVISTLKKLMQEALAACPAHQSNICRRRVVWMQEGFAPFFTEADLAHHWLRHPPAAAVPTVARPDDAAWSRAPRLKLSQGNYGSEADLATTVAVLRDAGSAYIRWVSSQAEPLEDGDSVTLRLKGDGKDEMAAVVHFDGKLSGADGKAEVLSSDVTDGNWTVTVKLAADALGLPPTGGKLSANFERFRQDDSKNKGRGRQYTWMPKMKPPWDWPMRYGTLTFAAAQ